MCPNLNCDQFIMLKLIFSFLNLNVSSKHFVIFFFRDHLAMYADMYPMRFILGYCSTYIFMQTFMIPGTIFMSLLAGALFGVLRGLFLVVFNATAGASSCFFLSKLLGRPIVHSLWPDKLRFFQSEVFVTLKMVTLFFILRSISFMPYIFYILILIL